MTSIAQILLIEPVWNRNMTVGSLQPHHWYTFNRTSMESKHRRLTDATINAKPFNRTSMESKPRSEKAVQIVSPFF